MSDPYVGEIRMFAGNFAPLGWAFCEGQLVSIAEQTVLFDLIGTTYGGDGQQTFALPDLRGRIPLHMGAGNPIGEMAGTESVTLLNSQMPAHAHVFEGSIDVATTRIPGGNVAAATIRNIYAPPGTVVTMSNTAIAATGGGQPHENRQPSLCVSFIISFFGIFPSQA